MTDQQPRSFANKLMHLIEQVHPPDRDPYSFREIEAGIRDRGLGSISGAYINQLANSKRHNPAMSVVQALADFFGVPPGYFFDDEVTVRIDAQLDDLARWRDTEARETAERIMKLPERDRRTVTNLLASLEQYEGQPRDNRRRRKPTSEA